MPKWKSHVCKVDTSFTELDEPPEKTDGYRKSIEPWLSAIFQSEHLALLVGSGLVTALASVAGVQSAGMEKARFDCGLAAEVDASAEESARSCGRERANLEDQLSAALSLTAGLRIMRDPRASEWESAINSALRQFLSRILRCEAGLGGAFDSGDRSGLRARNLLDSFLLSFASRTAARERLQVFTTNYDRVLEYGCDDIGLRAVDRFVGALSPRFRSSRLDVDLHYNPPGIRGEPRFLEGVIKFTKLHGSVDWLLGGDGLRRNNIPFGAGPDHPDMPESPLHAVMVYPNQAKEVATSSYPYAELFRDFSAAVCRPNSAIVTYGYGFGDDHVNRVLRDALTIPSAHLVIVSFDDVSGLVQRFCESVGRSAQLSLLIGSHFGALATLVDNYLPKPAIDRLSWRKAELLQRRGERPPTTRKTQGDEEAGT